TASSSREAQARQRAASNREAQARQRAASNREAQARQRAASNIVRMRRARAGFDLRAMQDPARIVVEGITPVHGRAVVPHYEIAGLPNPAPYGCFVGGISPEPVEYRLRVRKRQSLDISVATTAQVQNPAPGFRMSADKRMIYTRRMPRVIDGGCALPDISAGVIRGVMFQTGICYLLFELLGYGCVGPSSIAA